MTYPSIALALEMTGDVGNVILERIHERIFVSDRRYPVGELAVPKESVASVRLLIGFIRSCDNSRTAYLKTLPFDTAKSVR